MDGFQAEARTARQVEPSFPTPAPAPDCILKRAPQPSAVEPVARAQPRPDETARRPLPLATRRASGGRRLAIRWIGAGLKRLTTLTIALVAVAAGLVTWDYYVTAPWTRDGRVRVQVASVATKVSGQITELRVGDNQYVHKGDVLYVIDPFDF